MICYGKKTHLNYLLFPSICLQYRIFSILSFYNLNRPNVHIYSIQFSVFQFIFYRPSNRIRYQFNLLWYLLIFLKLVYVWFHYLGIILLFSFFIFTISYQILMVYFLLPKMKIWYIFIFIYFIDKSQWV
jgi:hypothetical protein